MIISAEEATIIATLTGALLPVLMFVYKIFKTSRVYLSEQEQIKNSIETIKAEVTHNGGKSLKDTVGQLKTTCDRIEVRQKVLDQRSVPNHNEDCDTCSYVESVQTYDT